MTQTAINNAQIMIEAVRVKSPKHPYVEFLNDFIKVMTKQNELLKEQEINVSQCFKTSLLFKTQANKASREKLEIEKKLISLTNEFKELNEKYERALNGI